MLPIATSTTLTSLYCSELTFSEGLSFNQFKKISRTNPNGGWSYISLGGLGDFTCTEWQNYNPYLYGEISNFDEVVSTTTASTTMEQSLENMSAISQVSSFNFAMFFVLLIFFITSFFFFWVMKD